MKIRILILAVITVLGAALGMFLMSPPHAPKENSADYAAYQRVLSDLEYISGRPHLSSIWGTEDDNAEVRNFLADSIREAGIEPVIEPAYFPLASTKRLFTYYDKTLTDDDGSLMAAIDAQCVYDGALDLYGVPFTTNVYAKVDAPGTDRAVLFMAHYDTVVESPGASDDGISVASLLQVVREQSSKTDNKTDLYFLFTDGEEFGDVGSSGFIYYHKSGLLKNVNRVYNFDVNRNSGGVYLYETSDGDYELVKDFLAANVYPLPFSFAEMPYHLSGKGTDLTAFLTNGYSGLNFSMTAGASVYHTAEDNFENLNKNSAYNIYKIASVLAEHSAKSGFVHDSGSKTDGVYFPVFKGVAVLIADYVSVIIGILAAVSGIAVILFSRKRKVKLPVLTIAIALFSLLSLGTVILLNAFSYLFWIPVFVLALVLLSNTLKLPSVLPVAFSAVFGVVIFILYYPGLYLMYYGMGISTLPVIIAVAALAFSAVAIPILSSGKNRR
jgi:hypothetical protein